MQFYLHYFFCFLSSMVDRVTDMPVHVEQRDGKWRLVDPNGKIVKNKGGTAADGGGHASHADAVRQAQAININQQGK